MSIIIPANSAVGGGFDVDNSVRYNGSNDSMNRTFAAGNQKTWTWSMWIKRSKLSVDQTLFGRMTSTGDAGWFSMSLNPDDTITFGIYNTNYRKTNRVFRDISAWYNIVLAFDTTQGTAANRIKFYINGVEETSFSISNDPSQNFDGPFNANAVHSLGIQPIPGGYEKYYGGYISEVTFIDGAANAVTDFGEFDEDSGIWKPVDVSGLTFGTNGFYLPFTNSGALGEDYSGEDHDWTTVNLAATDQSTDTCTNNFSTWNSLVHYSTSATFSEGNLKVAPTDNASLVYTVSTIAMPTVSGSKWYAEFKYLETGGVALIGILDAKQISYVFRNNTDLDNENGDTSVGRVTYRVGNGKIKYPSGQSVDTGVTLSNNDIVMIALDSGSGKIWFGKNGTWFSSGNPATGSNGVDFTGQGWWTAGVDNFVFIVGDGNSGEHDDWGANFGSPFYAVSSGNADGNGYGNFEYAVPSGFYSLNTKNLAEYG